jgi:hypothetical protein
MVGVLEFWDGYRYRGLVFVSWLALWRCVLVVCGGCGLVVEHVYAVSVAMVAVGHSLAAVALRVPVCGGVSPVEG